MKKNITLVLGLLFSIASFSQEVEIKRSSIGFSFSLIDFRTPVDFKNKGWLETIKAGDWTRMSQRMNPAISLSYWKGILTNLDFAATYTGSFMQHTPPSYNASNDVKFFQALDATLNAKMFKETAAINPFLTAGFGTYYFDNAFRAYSPLGLGLQFRASDAANILLQAQYKVNLGNKADNHLFYSLGVGVPFTKKKEVAPPPPPPPPAPEPEKPKDTDGDGIIDADDACPNAAGPASLKGCPDKDGDGIADKDDKCPDVAGLAKYNGCPIPDTDKDGINDEQDKCPNQAGVARYNGCPIPDRDGDGLNDEEDKCPDVAGPASNGGCPELSQYNFNAKNVQFATGSAVLTTGAKAELDKLVTIMNEHPELKVSIAGHTDNTGSAKINQALSQKRADAVKTYLVKKGISTDKLTAAGYGPDYPIADNKTSAGRAQNRRVEFKAAQ